MNLVSITHILETYDGRDKFLKTFSYAAKLATGLASSPETAEKFGDLASQMSGCRVILRLMDDIPILQETISYGWGKHETDRTTRWLNLLRNAIDFIASPIEHICWFGERKIIRMNQDFWDNISTGLWVIYLYISLMISLRKLGSINDRIEVETANDKNIESQGKATEIRRLNFQKQNEALTCLRLGLDVSYAVSYLPPGHFWGGYLKSWQIGALGTASSFIGLYQVFRNHLRNEDLSTLARRCDCHCHIEAE